MDDVKKIKKEDIHAEMRKLVERGYAKFSVQDGEQDIEITEAGRQYLSMTCDK